MTALEIAEALAELRPITPSEVDGSLSCFFCVAYEPEDVSDHERDCLWRAAVELTKRA
jgi:hypothetical protein